MVQMPRSAAGTGQVELQLLGSSSAADSSLTITVARKHHDQLCVASLLVRLRLLLSDMSRCEDLDHSISQTYKLRICGV